MKVQRKRSDFEALAFEALGLEKKKREIGVKSCSLRLLRETRIFPCLAELRSYKVRARDRWMHGLKWVCNAILYPPIPHSLTVKTSILRCLECRFCKILRWEWIPYFDVHRGIRVVACKTFPDCIDVTEIKRLGPYIAFKFERILSDVRKILRCNSWNSNKSS